MKKIVYGSFELESNSLTAILTGRKDFSLSVDMDNSGRTMAEDYLKSQNCEVIHTVHATAAPGGSVILEDFKSILSDMLKKFPEEKIDGVLIRMHGAMDVVGIGSGDLEIARAVREKIGPDVPFAVSFDLHADVDPQIAKYVNIICGYRTAPHTDIEDTHTRAAKLLLSCIENKYLPKPLIVKVPIIADGDTMTTDVYPGDKLIEKLYEIEKNTNISTLNIFLGNPWVDAVCAGGSVVAIPENGFEKEAEEAALALAKAFWDVRGEFKFRAPTASLEDGVKWALSNTKHPVFLSDSGDNVSGGGSGDNAAVLKRFLEEDATNILIAGIADKQIVETCRNLKPGDNFKCVIGGSLDPASTSVTVNATYKCSGAVNNWPSNLPIHSVLISVNGIDVIVNEERTLFITTAFFDEFGISPDKYQAVVLKLGYLWPEFYDVAKDFLMLLTKGSTCEIMTDCEFHIVPRPIYPIDKDMQWEPKIETV